MARPSAQKASRTMYSMRTCLPSILTMSPSWLTARALSTFIRHDYLTGAAFWVIYRADLAPGINVWRLAERILQPFIVLRLSRELAGLGPLRFDVAWHGHRQEHAIESFALKKNRSCDSAFRIDPVLTPRLVDELNSRTSAYFRIEKPRAVHAAVDLALLE